MFQMGLAAVQIARANGLTVYGTAGCANGMQLTLASGAHKVFNHNEQGYRKKILVCPTVYTSASAIGEPSVTIHLFYFASLKVLSRFFR